MAKAEDLIAAGYAASRAGRAGDAQSVFAKAMMVATDVGDPAMLARAATGMGKIERDLGHVDSARNYYQQAVELLRGLNEPLRLAHTVRHVGDILSDQGKFDEAVPCYEDALKIYRGNTAADVLDVANAVAGYARLRDARGEAEAALALWREARELYAAAGVQAGMDEAASAIHAIAASASAS